MKKYIWSAITGMGFGFPITLLSMALIGGWHSVLRELAVWMAASALYGLLTVTICSIKVELPLPVQIALHILGCAAITLAAALLCGYVSGPEDLLPVLVPALIIYAAVCLLFFLLMKKDEKQVNEALRQKE